MVLITGSWYQAQCYRALVLYDQHSDGLSPPNEEARSTNKALLGLPPACQWVCLDLRIRPVVPITAWCLEVCQALRETPVNSPGAYFRTPLGDRRQHFKTWWQSVYVCDTCCVSICVYNTSFVYHPYRHPQLMMNLPCCIWCIMKHKLQPCVRVWANFP